MSNQSDDGPVGGFRQRLYQLRREKGWSQSELARRVWGEIPDGRGYMVAKNRDRISAYEAGRATPERSNLDGIADALGVSVEDLAPDLVLSNPRIAPASALMTFKLVGATGNAHLKVDAVVPANVAIKVLELLQAAKPGAPPEAA